MRNVSDKICRGIQNTHFVFSNFFENRVVYVEKYYRAEQATDDNTAHAHCMLDTNTHSEYAVLIAIPLQK